MSEGTFEVTVQNVTFVVEAADKEAAASQVESDLMEIASEWGSVIV